MDVKEIEIKEVKIDVKQRNHLVGPPLSTLTLDR